MPISALPRHVVESLEREVHCSALPRWKMRSWEATCAGVRHSQVRGSLDVSASDLSGLELIDLSVRFMSVSDSKRAERTMLAR
jgi:hypothetical protein